jgi:hypothetical protein
VVKIGLFWKKPQLEIALKIGKYFKYLVQIAFCFGAKNLGKIRPLLVKLGLKNL